ncbi:MAG TPA: hypothetical protein VK927_08580, partial [Adhaeribacter sp.]|nr:hypothetical protein [Adhaeribacter sp.]
MKNNILMLAGFLGLAACSGLENESEVAVDTETVVTFNDFEGLDGWAEVPASVNKERAHSGKYSIKVDGNNEFSFGFQKQLGQITQSRPKQFTLSAMAFVPSQEAGKAALVLSLTDPVANEQV